MTISNIQRYFISFIKKLNIISFVLFCIYVVIGSVIVSVEEESPIFLLVGSAAILGYKIIEYIIIWLFKNDN